MAERRGDDSSSSNNDRRESRDCGPTEKKDRNQDPPIFGHPDGRWRNIPVILVPEYPLDTLRVYFDNDPTSEDTIYLVGYEEIDGTWTGFWFVVGSEEPGYWDAVKAQILDTIFSEDEASANWVSIEDSRLEYEDSMIEAMIEIEDDEIGSQSLDFDWDSEGHQYQD